MTKSRIQISSISSFFWNPKKSNLSISTKSSKFRFMTIFLIFLSKFRFQTGPTFDQFRTNFRIPNWNNRKIRFWINLCNWKSKYSIFYCNWNRKFSIYDHFFWISWPTFCSMTNFLFIPTFEIDNLLIYDFFINLLNSKKCRNTKKTQKLGHRIYSFVVFLT